MADEQQPDDPYWLQVARRAASLIGVGDPVGTVTGIAGAPVDVPPGAVTSVANTIQRGGKTVSAAAAKAAETVGLADFVANTSAAVQRGTKAVMDLRPAALQKLGPAKWRRGQEGRYADAVLTGNDADHVMAAIENVAKRFPRLKPFLPEMAKALESHPPSGGTLAASVIREPDSGLILPNPRHIARWARYGLYGEDIPANWGPMTQPGIRPAFGPDKREIKLYADLWGAQSPVNDPLTNTLQANRVLARTLGPEGFAPMEEAEFNQLGLGLPSRRDNVNRAMAGEPLWGPKVPRMSGMVEGTSTLPPIDEHVVTASGGASGKWDAELSALRKRIMDLTGEEFVGPKGRMRLNELVSEGLVEMWRAMYPHRPPLTSMAAGWEGIRSDKGIKSVGGPYDILRKLGLGEKGAMIDPKKLLGAKWPGGYISSGLLLPLLLDRWRRVTDAQPENAPTAQPPQ